MTETRVAQRWLDHLRDELSNTPLRLEVHPQKGHYVCYYDFDGGSVEFTVVELNGAVSVMIRDSDGNNVLMSESTVSFVLERLAARAADMRELRHEARRNRHEASRLSRAFTGLAPEFVLEHQENGEFQLHTGYRGSINDMLAVAPLLRDLALAMRSRKSQ